MSLTLAVSRLPMSTLILIHLSVNHNVSSKNVLQEFCGDAVELIYMFGDVFLLLSYLSDCCPGEMLQCACFALQYLYVLSNSSDLQYWKDKSEA